MLKRLFSSKSFTVCAVFLAIVILAGIFAPLVAPNNPNEADLTVKLQGPSLTYPMGTDHVGRCILSRCIFGIRTSLGISVVIGVCSVLIGLSVGVFSGYIGGKVDSVIMRICDALLAYPSMILVLIIVAVLGIGMRNIFIAMLLVHWIWYARVTRSMALSLKSHNFVQAATVCGSGTFKIIGKHLFPNIIPQLFALFAVDLAGIILQLAGFSFLGIGVQPPTAEWGTMINEGRSVIRQNVMVMGWPSLVIVLVVLAMNVVGEGLRQKLEEA